MAPPADCGLIELGLWAPEPRIPVMSSVGTTYEAGEDDPARRTRAGGDVAATSGLSEGDMRTIGATTRCGRPFQESGKLESLPKVN